MADVPGGERTEQATPKRREEARKHGQVVLSPEVSPVLVLVTALVVGTWGAPVAVEQARAVLRGWLQAVGTAPGREDVPWALVGRAAFDLGAVVAPLVAAVAAVGTAAVVAQVGFQVQPELALPRLERLGGGWKRLLSAQSVAGLVKAVAKIALVLAVAWNVLLALGQAAVAAPAMPPAEILALVGAGLRRLLLAMAFPLAALGAADWAWQKRRFEHSLRMSRQEVKEEHKQSEGDPHIRGRFRRAHRELARRRMLADVKTADVVLTNPTHVAVALRYRPSESGAPRVLAKGADEMAQRIKDAARAAGVPIVERRALARALFQTVRIGAEIPNQLYKAVAEILAYIYALRGFPGEGGR